VGVVRILFCAAVFLIACVVPALADGPKIALVISNRAYHASMGALENTHSDGERMAATLTALGFAVIHKRDLDKAGTMAALTEYVQRLESAGSDAIGFLYYAGHGAANSKHGDNYLIPVDASITSDSQLPLQAIKLGDIIDAIADTSIKTNFLVFDACRDVPISFSVRSAMRGLRPEGHRQDMLIAFATAPGKTATDEGVYAKALSEEMQRPGVLATEVFRAVRSRVLKATKNRQFPWIEDGLVVNPYFTPPAPQTAFAAPTKPAGSTNQPTPVTDCDLYAASPTDPERQSPGVRLEKIDANKALFACRAASEAHPHERRFLYQLARTYHAAKDFGRAREIYGQLDASGYAAATFSLGVMFHRGEGVAQDIAEAARLFRKAADLGEPDAMRNLGWMYSKGEEVAQDKVEAVHLYRRAADLGDAAAMRSLGWMYSAGEGVAPNKAEAVRLYRKAADLGDVDAMRSLGWIYSQGEGVAQDKVEAARFYQKAADLGDADSMLSLAAMYDNGDALARNRGRAAQLIVSAVRKRHSATLQQAPYEMWSEAFRRDLQQLLKRESVYKGRIDGEASEALRNAVLALAAKSKGGG